MDIIKVKISKDKLLMLEVLAKVEIHSSKDLAEFFNEVVAMKDKIDKKAVSTDGAPQTKLLKTKDIEIN